MSAFLDAMAVSSAARVPGPLSPTVTDGPRLVLGKGPGLIAEVKLAAPSAGTLRAPDDPIAFVVEQARAYERAGAVAISVLTEPSRFMGRPEYLKAVVDAVAIPVMRKDFLVDPMQVREAAHWGASGVLLITRMVSDQVLQAQLDEARACGLFALVECFDEEDAHRVAHLRGPGVLVGINTRDLQTLDVVPERLSRLVGLLPPVPKVAESGMRTARDTLAAFERGYDLALVGSALMQADDPSALAAAMVGR